MTTPADSAGQSKTPSPSYVVQAANTKKLVHQLRAVQRSKPADLARVEDAIKQLAANPRPFGSEKLDKDTYRLRCGDWRIIYRVSDEKNEVRVGAVRRRNERTYRDDAADLFD